MWSGLAARSSLTSITQHKPTATLRRSALDIGSVDALYLTAEELSDFSAGMARACIGVAAEVLAELDREADSLPRSHVRR